MVQRSCLTSAHAHVVNLPVLGKEPVGLLSKGTLILFMNNFFPVVVKVRSVLMALRKGGELDRFALSHRLKILLTQIVGRLRVQNRFFVINKLVLVRTNRRNSSALDRLAFEV